MTSFEVMADSPITFPEKGALPACYPPDRPHGGNQATEEGYFIFHSPQRSLVQIAQIQSEMPVGQFPSPPNDWAQLQRTQRILTQGGRLHLLALEDSIINDTMRSGWVAKLGEVYPKAVIQATVYVHGGGGCQHFKEEERIATNVTPRQPNLIFIGGISQSDIDSIHQVIDQVRPSLPEVEFLLVTGAFGTVDPRNPEAIGRVYSFF